MIQLLIAAWVSTATVGPTCRERYKPEHEDADFMVRDCRGTGGFKLRVDIEDARDDVILTGRDGVAHSLNLDATVAKGEFSEVRGAALWWTEKKAPTALVVKLAVQEPDDSERGFHVAAHFVVAKITPEVVCVVFDERKLADAKGRAKDAVAAPCLPVK
jgi:hypothetical protein